MPTPIPATLLNVVTAPSPHYHAVIPATPKPSRPRGVSCTEIHRTAASPATAIEAPAGGRERRRRMASRSAAARRFSDGGGGVGDGNRDQAADSTVRYGMNGCCGEHRQPSSPKLLTLPTVLTLGRVAAVPILVVTYHMNDWWATSATTSIFLAAAITDWLDGYIARKMQLGSAFGAFLDPVADKLMVAATLVLLCTKPLEVAIFGQAPWLLTVPSIAIIGREITMSAVREWAASQNTSVLEAVAVNNLGKWKTATQMTALTILLATRDPRLMGPSFVVACGVILLYISGGLAVWSLAVYMKKVWGILLK